MNNSYFHYRVSQRTTKKSRLLQLLVPKDLLNGILILFLSRRLALITGPPRATAERIKRDEADRKVSAPGGAGTRTALLSFLPFHPASLFGFKLCEIGGLT